MAKFEEVDVGQSVIMEDDAQVYVISAWNQSHTKVWIEACNSQRTLKLVPIESVERWG